MTQPLELVIFDINIDGQQGGTYPRAVLLRCAARAFRSVDRILRKIYGMVIEALSLPPVDVETMRKALVDSGCGIGGR
ncbi:MAG: hypothetical protein LBD79_05430 [Treponema sp.]|jgi:hypothetical protein|nr:hypothetical protein [Treponema sp.]